MLYEVITNLTQEMGGVSKVIQAATDVIHSEIVRKIKNCLVEALEKGELQNDKERHIDDLSEFIVSSWQGTLLRIKAKNSKKLADDFYKIFVITSYSIHYTKLYEIKDIAKAFDLIYLKF